MLYVSGTRLLQAAEEESGEKVAATHNYLIDVHILWSGPSTTASSHRQLIMQIASMNPFSRQYFYRYSRDLH